MLKSAMVHISHDIWEISLLSHMIFTGSLVWMVNHAPRDFGLLQVFEAFPVLFMLTLGVLSAHLSNRVIIATVTRIPYPTIEWLVFLPLVLLVATEDAFQENRQGQLDVFAAFDLLVVGVYCHFAINVGYQLAKHLKINILTLGKRSH
jgi:hypothetical protein